MTGLMRCAAVLAALAIPVSSAMALEAMMQYVGTNGTWNLASNWQELVHDPSGYYVLDPSHVRVPSNWEAPGGKDILDPNTWRDESAYVSNGRTVTLNAAAGTIANLIVGPHADTVRDYSVGDPNDPSYGVMIPTGLPSTLVITEGANLYLNRVGETHPGQAGIDVNFRQQSAYGANILQTGGRVSTVFTHIAEAAATNVSNGLRPYQGTVTYGMSGGTLESRFKMGVGESLAVSTGDSEAWGYFDLSGGLVTIGNTSAGGELGVGVGGRGTFGVTGGTVRTVWGTKSAGVVIGYGSDPSAAAIGEMTQSGGEVYASKFLQIGRDSGVGTYAISDGLLRIGAASGEQTDSDIGLGGSNGPAEGSLLISGGSVELIGTKSLRIGNSNSASSEARGTVRMTGGTFVIASSAAQSVLVGYNKLLGDPRTATGVLEVTGGSFHASKTLTLGINKGNAALVLGKDATFVVGGLTTASTAAGGTARISLQLAGASSFSRIQVQRGTVNLGGGGYRTIEMLSSDYRPREGDALAIITGAGSEITGTPTQITTNITLAPGKDPNGVLLPFFSGGAFMQDPSTYGYQLRFWGLTAGDANGDHEVDGGDLALIGGNWMKGELRPVAGDCNLDDEVDGGDLALMGGGWMKTGTTWADGDFNGDHQVDGSDLALMGGNWMKRLMAWEDCDFNGDGLVDGSDLALMGGNWMWTLPTEAPQPQGAPLPEPATLALLGLGAATLIRPKR
ncbi:MAG: hypothetical protein MUP47_07570 [Phycisphaerae bacterium]|nr:hypothetical protein [Phycisphaerae bacterium]